MRSATPAAMPVIRPLARNPLAGTSGFLWTFRICVYEFLLIAVCLGGPVLRVGAIAAVLLVPLADRAGAIRWVFRTIGLAAAIALAPVTSIPLGAWAAARLGMSAPVALIGAFVVVTSVLAIVGSRIGRSATRPTLRRRYLYVMNRSAGSLLGVGDGALVAVAFCWLLGLFGPTISVYSAVLADKRPNLARWLGHADGLREWVEQDAAGRWLRDVNPLPHVPQVATLAAGAEVYAEPWLFWEAVNRGDLADLLAIPVVRKHYEAVRADPAMRQAVKRHDLQTVLNSRHYVAAINDQEFCAVMAQALAPDPGPNLRRRTQTRPSGGDRTPRLQRPGSSGEGGQEGGKTRRAAALSDAGGAGPTVSQRAVSPRVSSR